MDPSAWIALKLSLKVACWATALDLLFGVALGYLLARKRFPGRELLDAALTLPMVMPPTVLGYYLLVLIGRNGAIGGWLQQFDPYEHEHQPAAAHTDGRRHQHRRGRFPDDHGSV